jgi:hypothetical protein
VLSFVPRYRSLPALVVSGALALALAPAALPFHDDGTARCSACHVTHGERPEVGDGLLRAGNATDTCLRCHESRHGNTWGPGDDPLAPGDLYGGGQFVFLLEDNLNDTPGGAAEPIAGHAAGHSIISLDKGTSADPVHAVAPGGTYPSSAMHCTSCHDPHGKGGHFRLLYGSDHPESRAGGHVFSYTYPAPDAEGIPLHGPAESDSHHSAYRSGMSDWCANCHGHYHDDSSPGGAFEHPVDELLPPQIAEHYNRYDGTGQPPASEPYLALVPFEDPAVGIGYTGTASSGSSRITCVTCHRAHASSAPRAGRWDFNVESWAAEGVESGSFPIPNPYPAAGSAQEDLCHKCHEN